MSTPAHLFDIHKMSPPTFEGFVSEGNEEAFAAVQDLACGVPEDPCLYLWGKKHSGKSHLLAAAQDNRADLFVVDDAELLSVEEQMELFSRFNEVRAGNGRLLVAGKEKPTEMPFREDLRTRLAAGLVFQLYTLSEKAKRKALLLHARRKGVQLPEEVAELLTTRLDRNLGELISGFESLDRHALAHNKPITISSAKQWLEKRAAQENSNS